MKYLIPCVLVLTYNNSQEELILENHACEYGLRSALIQKERTAAYASRSLSKTERRYAQREREKDRDRDRC